MNSRVKHRDGRDAPAGGSKGPQARAVVDWFDQEAPVGATIVKLGRRMFRRGRASWAIWGLAALLISGVVTLVKVKGNFQFAARVVVHVSEGRVSQPGSALGHGNLRAYVNEMALTNRRLLDLMSKHPGAFPKVTTDPVFAVEGFRENMKVEIAENDFVEERSANEPPRSARLLITFTSTDPELTWQVAQELADLVAGSTIAGQRGVLEAELQAATASAANAAAEVSAVEEQKIVGPNPKLDTARQRLLTAQLHVQDINIALRALGRQQGLRFEIVDRGKMPLRPNPVEVGIKTFAITLVLALLVGWMLAGAFDPRVVDEADLTDLGLPHLGHLPALPLRGDAEPPGDRSREPDSRV